MEIITTKEEPSCYICIGVSVNNLNSLNEFFKRVPEDLGAAFIIIQSVMNDESVITAQMLDKNICYEKHQVVQDLKMQANTIYFLPQCINITVVEGHLIITSELDIENKNSSVDFFLCALAEDQRNRAIGILFSSEKGLGLKGMQYIKDKGGMVFIQKTSLKDGSIESYLGESGLSIINIFTSDVVNNLIEYIKEVRIPEEENVFLKDEEENFSVLKEICALLKQYCEIDFSQYKSSMITRRIERRMALHQFSNVTDYRALLTKSSEELYHVTKDMLIGVTKFFRDTEAFADLKKTIIPKIIKNIPRSDTIRVWISGCSTGQEVFSIAILFDDVMHNLNMYYPIKIFATDVNSEAIAKASMGQFDRSIENDVSAAYLQKYFIEEEDGYTIVPEIRQMIIFAKHNIIKDPPFLNTHLTVCRNLLIYLRPEVQKHVLAILHFSLSKEGFLFLGLSESLREVESYFEPIHERSRIFRKIINTYMPTNTVVPQNAVNPVSSNNFPSVENLLKNYQGNNRNEYNAVLEKLLEDYAPACILINKDFEIIHVYGDLSNYTHKIKAGKFNGKISSIIIQELSVGLFTALHRAQKLKQDIKYENIKYKNSNDEMASINLCVRYICDTESGNLYYLILFENFSTHPIKKEDHTILYNASEQSQQRIYDLEIALQRNEEHLQGAVEELKSVNEELQSSNEELLAANEELQSVNEELYTVNSEYHQKIEEITQVNTDVDNIIKSTDIGIVFLDQTMLIRKFTPAATKYFNLMASDVGRPFHHIANNLIYDELLTQINTVIDKVYVFEKEIQTVNSNTIILKITPYYTERKQSKGCVITVTDVSELRLLEGKLSETYQELRATIGTSLLRQQQTVHVLIVDDAEADRELLKRYLYESSTSKYIIQEAASYDQAKKLLMMQSFDVCLIDYRLDNQTAFELLESLPETHQPTAFILLSGMVNNKIYEKAIELGVYDAVDKATLNSEIIERCIRYTLRHRQTEMYLTRQQADRKKFLIDA